MHQTIEKKLQKLFHEQCNKQAVSLHRDCVLVVLFQQQQTIQTFFRSVMNRTWSCSSGQEMLKKYIFDGTHNSAVEVQGSQKCTPVNYYSIVYIDYYWKIF